MRLAELLGLLLIFSGQILGLLAEILLNLGEAILGHALLHGLGELGLGQRLAAHRVDDVYPLFVRDELDAEAVDIDGGDARLEVGGPLCALRTKLGHLR